ncbi:glutamate synthase large subunit [Bradyrhizobium sp. U87765 SZCCT0131]|uniref:glutamate synthase large subunit n=1 Tax=unclassified Bradyrhizobium TaxID=2631580 RepID=UPI001BA5BE99|nr:MULTISPECIES: glutamate synthase large subunit [unclassified Bradyrhizobium]MBR1221995.1 glutamate synthase large subunit [Bradyrhizobium sp. U87765 SZCCT0131]MBR1263807.1 glutamate synthase large subunit [Bradyrhizobium sp. U87765 SZCCT0134]MBR1302623.1 glutamate synthase large subunit [Bradyrhizobium sp. U87765 SZCCT0110]MBR1320057.1 glutamate synthase large subunit [Bradyrhizobium sp. U87765 SZCCT0109]MBR1348830.1 glutamate synthase large subunit [Bradyrhizobium sp. U87765 SZCCT0048]
MSGSKFERDEIGAHALSTDCNPKMAKPAAAEAATREHTREHTWRPPAEGLYDLGMEKDSCGVGFIANIKGKKSHQIVSDALSILCNLEHRGAVGADPRAGDGAGILVQIPHGFFARKAKELGFTLPAPGQYAVGAVFMPREKPWREVIQSIVSERIKSEGLTLLGWRDVPTDNSSLGETVKPTEPSHMQVFIGCDDCADQDDFERRLYILRKSISNAIYQRRERSLAGYYPVSMSCRTVVYKGMFLADQLGKYYPDLHEPDFESALALVHQRFSTNTFPTWSLAHPYRMIAHNGEINTLRGNVNWMAARQASVSSERFGEDIEKLWPISYEGQSDTACFDNALEFLVQGGYSLPHAVMMMIPEAWAGNPLMDEKRRAFYEYHAALMEPWDGPAAIAFTNGLQIGATLDRNGLRPARYLVTKDDRIVMASEMGVLKIPEDQIVTKWRLQPGKMLLVDLEKGRLIPDDEIKASLAQSHPYREWLDRTQIVLEELQDAPSKGARSNLPLLDRQQAFGYTQEDVNILLSPMASLGEEATGSMGTDTPISALSDRPKQLFTYFKQNFAQVTNPPIDPIREEIVMSLVSFIGPRPNLFDLEGMSRSKRLEVRQPILTDADLEKIRSISEIAESHFRSRTLDTTFHAGFGAAGMEQVLDELCGRAEAAVREGVNIIILSDRMAGTDRIPIPSLLACAAVHHHLIRTGLRTSVGLVVESGEPREVHHFACLAGYGAEAINPYLAFETLIAMKDKLPAKLDDKEIVKRYIKAIGKGLMKVMSKMGISTYQSYCGAQIFDAVGLKADFVAKYFAGTHTRIEGVGLAEIAEETARRHTEAFGDSPVFKNALDVGGEYAFRTRGEDHAWTAESVAALQHAARGNSLERYKAFAKILNEQSERLLTIRGLFRIKSAEEEKRKPVPLAEVESAKDIVRRFATGAMSFGSISREAHTTLAIAMNRIGGKSNTGEGGEEADRFKPLPNGDSMRSAIKQVASGRFGVTTEYLVNSDMMQIKMAQGAKPGEGGQLPGHKVDATIAKVRHSTPGVGLISPPPHHDIYSIEDLAQLIYDLKNVNPDGQVSVKLVSEIGVGTVAAGVAKARADHVTISGFEGGTGASPLTSIKHAGSPWEIGLAETHQTLVRERLRSRIVVQVDGGFRTGRDVVIGALLGADEFGFATAPLIAAGCIMMRKCHLNTCPVGVATQDPVLRKRFTGQPEHVINYFFFVAEEVREIMASLGFRTFNEMIGQSQLLDQNALVAHWKAKGLDFSKLFFKQKAAPGTKIHHSELQDHHLDKVLDRKLIADAQPALDRGAPVKINAEINNTDRSAGAMLSGMVAKRFGHEGLPLDTIHVKLQGTAGQAFGAWLARGVTFELEGEGNDYVGKGLSGGRIIVKPPAISGVVPEESIIVGNTVMYGAIEGDCYFRGVAGERFAVRNSGAIAVVEGAGDHCCEYMTGGVVVVLGRTGRNFAAGMSGGVAYVLDEDGTFEKRCNLAMVELEPVLSEEMIAENAFHQNGDLEAHGKVDVLANLTGDDVERLHVLITRHAKLTGSARAAEILANWKAVLPKFRKVMPVEFRRALNEMKKRESEEPKIAIGA